MLVWQNDAVDYHDILNELCEFTDSIDIPPPLSPKDKIKWYNSKPDGGCLYTSIAGVYADPANSTSFSEHYQGQGVKELIINASNTYGEYSYEFKKQYPNKSEDEYKNLFVENINKRCSLGRSIRFSYII